MAELSGRLAVVTGGAGGIGAACAAHLAKAGASVPAAAERAAGGPVPARPGLAGRSGWGSPAGARLNSVVN